MKDSRLESTHSEVYGETIDVVSGPDKIEIGSAAMGPHPLDHAWRITDTWVGIGFGLERLIMAAEGSDSLGGGAAAFHIWTAYGSTFDRNRIPSGKPNNSPMKNPTPHRLEDLLAAVRRGKTA